MAGKDLIFPTIRKQFYHKGMFIGPIIETLYALLREVKIKGEGIKLVLINSQLFQQLPRNRNVET